jgi:hypothetical protein
MLEQITSGIRLTEAAKLVPGRNGKGVQVTTIKRWITHGCRGVRLRGWMVGGVWYTSREALEEFQRACTPESCRMQTRTPAETRRAALAAMKRMGFEVAN